MSFPIPPGIDPLPPRPERTPTDVLVERARRAQKRLIESRWADLNHPSPLSELILANQALADRFAELAALEPVGELLAVMRAQVGAQVQLHLHDGEWWAEVVLRGPGDRMRPITLRAEARADTPEAALAALAAAVQERAQ